jgi:hypothetical protein
MQLLIPSIYWPMARLGFSGNRNRRKVFRRIVSGFYRKRVWNILINSWAKQKGLDRREYTIQNNVHSFASALLILMALYWMYHAEYLQAIGLGIADILINAPAIVLSRYLYLITIRRAKR